MPLSIIDAFSVKINDVVAGPDVISNSRTFGRSFDVFQMFFFSGIKSSAGFSNITPRTICTGNFIQDIGLRFLVMLFKGEFDSNFRSYHLFHPSKTAVRAIESSWFLIILARDRF